MRRTIFIIKTLVIFLLLIWVVWIASTSSSHRDDNNAYIRVIDPYQSKADLQQTKNILHGYLQATSQQSIGLILGSQEPLFLLPPTYDTGTLRTYIESIQSQDQGAMSDISSLVKSYSAARIFVSSSHSHTYKDIQDFASIDPSIAISAEEDIASSWKIGIPSILLLVALLI